MDIEDIFDIDLSRKKARGRSFTSEDNPQHQRWVCIACGMESNIGGIIRHHKKSGHIGKQRARLLDRDSTDVQEP
tara:strand:- start:635 stop:859 length:225 start_codon:yes stop_codon:yes gene_type:complete